MVKRSSQLQSGFIQVQVVVHVFCMQGFSVTPFAIEDVQQTKNWVAKGNLFCDCIFVPKMGVILAIFMNYWKTIHALMISLWGVFMCFYANINATLELGVHKGYVAIQQYNLSQLLFQNS